MYLFLCSILDTELPFEVITHAGGDEYWHDPMTLGEFLPFAAYSALAFVVLAQLFIPALRRGYAAGFRFGLDLIGLKAKRAESAKMLADAFSRYVFTGGLCSFPLGLMLWEDTFRPSLGGPLGMGFAFVGLALTQLLLLVAFIIFAIATFFSWQKLHRVEKVNPLAASVAAKLAKKGLPAIGLLLLLNTCPATGGQQADGKFAEASLVEQLLTLPDGSVDDNDVRAQFDLLAALFTSPSGAQLAEPLLYHQACAKLLPLLRRADAVHTQEMLRDLPAWQPESWQGTPTAARGMLYALQQDAASSLPAAFLEERARAMLAAGRPDVAHAFARLMERDPQAGGRIDGLCAEGTPDALRAAAWSCRLHRAGLPALSGGEVRAFFHIPAFLGIGELPETVQLAIRADESARCVCVRAGLIEPERLFYTGSGQCSALPVEATEAALRALPAPRAADWYTRCEGDPQAASLELELALAAFIWAHRNVFGGEDAPEA